MSGKQLLQVANVPTILGGTGACAWSIGQAFPDWSHVMAFVNSGKGPVPEFVQREFQCPILRSADAAKVAIQKYRPDAVIWHNSGPGHMPDNKQGAWIYYQHSPHGGARRARSRCDHVLTVSRYLARQVDLQEENVFYQPCPVPPLGEKRADFDELVIGRLATPGNRRKWQVKELVPFYQELSEKHPNVSWEFIGCPADLIEPLKKACRGRSSFHPASWNARGLFRRWHAVLYHSSLSETYGRTVCEAQRGGCVPIVDRAGGFVEQIHHGRDGYLCDSVEDFSQAIEKLQDREHWSSLSERAIELANHRGGFWSRRARLLKVLSGL